MLVVIVAFIFELLKLGRMLPGIRFLRSGKVCNADEGGDLRRLLIMTVRHDSLVGGVLSKDRGGE